MIRLVLGSLLLACLIASAPAREALAETFDLEEGQVRIRLDPDWPAAMVGEPLYLSLTIENLGAKDVYYGDGFTRNPLGRPDFVRLEALREDGEALPVPDAGPNFGGGYGPRRLASGERQTLRLFLPHWAKITEPGTYTITCRRAYDFYDQGPRSQPRPPQPARTLDVVLSAVITIDAFEPARIPAVLRRWDGPLRGPDTDAASEATRALASITDPRVIVPLQTGIASGYYGIMLPCISAHAKFEDDLALSGLKMAMALDLTKLKEMPDPATGATLLMNLRSAAAGALGMSRHPDARAYLRTFEEDPLYQVRLNVVHTSGRHGEAEDVALLERRTRDPNELVRSEAARYLALLAE